MPSKIDYPCKVYKCQNFVYKSGFCTEHYNEHQEEKAKMYGYKDTEFYNSTRWRALRRWHISGSPLCVVCGDIGHVVDHKIPIRQGGEKYDINNLQTLCEKCHNEKRAHEKKLYG